MQKFARLTGLALVTVGLLAATSSFAAPTKTMPMPKWPPMIVK